MKWQISYIFIFISVFHSAQSYSCPDFYKNLDTKYLSTMNLCSAYDRYHNAVNALKQNGVSAPERISSIMAPRFINYPYWKKKAPQFSYNPWYIYSPAPESWKKWEAGALIVDTLAAKNQQMGKINLLDIAWLNSLHSKALDGLLDEKQKGSFRTGSELGRAFDRQSSLTMKQINGLEKLGYFSSTEPTKSLISWNPTICLEDKSEEKQKEYKANSRIVYLADWPEISRSIFFTDSAGNKRQCGYIRYTSQNDLEPQMALWLNYVNSMLQNINKQSQNIDPIYFAAKAQQWFIVIHPYVGGNGRMSRFLMDYILQSLGLPSAVLQNMDEDIYNTPEDWAKEVGKGIEYAIKYAEYCASSEVSKVGCNQITKEPTKDQEGK